MEGGSGARGPHRKQVCPMAFHTERDRRCRQPALIMGRYQYLWQAAACIQELFVERSIIFVSRLGCQTALQHRYPLLRGWSDALDNMKGGRLPQRGADFSVLRIIGCNQPESGGTHAAEAVSLNPDNAGVERIRYVSRYGRVQEMRVGDVHYPAIRAAEQPFFKRHPSSLKGRFQV
jgi:hypothetical protein